MLSIDEQGDHPREEQDRDGVFPSEGPLFRLDVFPFEPPAGHGVVHVVRHLPGLEERDAEDAGQGLALGPVLPYGAQFQSVQHVDAHIAEHDDVLDGDVQREDKNVRHVEPFQALRDLVERQHLGHEVQERHGCEHFQRDRQHGAGRAAQRCRQEDENGEEHRRQRRLDASCQRLVAEEQRREQGLCQNGVREDHVLRDRHQDDEQEDRQQHDRRARPDESFGRPLPDAGQDRQDGETALRQEAV